MSGTTLGGRSVAFRFIVHNMHLALDASVDKAIDVEIPVRC